MKNILIFTLVFVSVVTFSIGGLAGAPEANQFFCRSALNGEPQRTFAQINEKTPFETMRLSSEVSIRLRLSGKKLLIGVYHGAEVVSKMEMKNTSIQFAMTAGGVEMTCFSQRMQEF